MHDQRINETSRTHSVTLHHHLPKLMLIIISHSDYVSAPLLRAGQSLRAINTALTTSVLIVIIQDSKLWVYYRRCTLVSTKHIHTAMPPIWKNDDIVFSSSLPKTSLTSRVEHSSSRGLHVYNNNMTYSTHHAINNKRLQNVQE